MNFILKDNKKFNSGDTIFTYSYDKIDNINDIKDFVASIEKDYGEVEEINVSKIDNDNYIYSESYNDLNEFINNFNKEDLTVLNFSLRKRNVVFTLNTDLKILNINNLEHSLGPKTHDIEKIKYYKNQYDRIIKYDGNNSTYYILDNITGKWIKDNSVMKEFYDSEYDIEEINYDDNQTKNL